MKYALLLTSCATGLTLAACSDKKDEPTPAPALATETVSNLAAGVSAPSGGGQPVVSSKYTFYSFATNAVVPNSDSATTKWDLGFRGTTIIVNGGASGPGQGGALVQTGLFADLTTAPETGYGVDSPTAKAIPTGSGNGWYTYNSSTNIITPIAGKVLLVRTATGKYAKLEIVSYYKDAPATPTATSVSRYYTFRRVYQPDGSRNLK
jgi:HmuY protein